nr:cytochrome b [Nemalecium lighti]
MRLRTSYPILSTINRSLVDLQSPSSLSYLWNFGSLLGLCLIIQILTGVLLAMHYCPDTSLAFQSISHILRDVNKGFLLKYTHANGASLFFICVYIHIGRSLYYGGFYNKPLWASGVIILLIMMATAFMGYVLPWGQMSFWGATVITNFVSAIPYVGIDIVQWLWGGYSVNNATLNRFFSFHYLLPFILSALVVCHLVFLHNIGSSSPSGVETMTDNIPFHPYYTFKDIFGFLAALTLFISFVIYLPNLLGDPENFIKANALVTPTHIMPEWYFLFAYAILRAIPNKLGGVLALIFSILILLILPFNQKSHIKSLTFKPLSKILFWLFIANFWLLTWIGAQPVEEPFILLGQLSTIFYYSYFMIITVLSGVIENTILFSKK